MKHFATPAIDRRTALHAGLLAASGALLVQPAAYASEAAPVPAADPDPQSPFGIDRSITMETIDDYIGRSDIAFRDMRMVRDPADYAAIGGSALLDFVLEGFTVVPFPLIGTLQELPVEGAYTGPTLFDVTWNEDGTVADTVPLYEESLLIVEELFPQDRPLFLMCGAGGYAGMTRQLLIYLGWDPELVYNIGGAWEYTGYKAVPVVNYGNEGDEPRFYLWRVPMATIDFDQYRAL